MSVATNGATATKGSPVPVGNAPNSVLAQGQYLYITNEGGRVATAGDFTSDSSGTPIVANKVHGSSMTGTISVYDTKQGIVVANIDAGGRHPTSMAISGSFLFVTNMGSENIGVIDLRTNRLMRIINVALPLPGEKDNFGNHFFSDDWFSGSICGSRISTRMSLRFSLWVSRLRAAGFAVVTFDQPGHGCSTGDLCTLQDFVTTILAVGRRYGKPTVAIGHSLGAAALTLAQSEDWHAQRMVIISPPADLEAAADRFMRFVRLGRHLRGRPDPLRLRCQ